MASKLTPGAVALADFLHQHQLTQAQCGVAIGVTDVAVHEWVTGAHRPRVEYREAIELWTNGHIPRSAWDTDADRAALANIKPHTPLSPAPETSATHARASSGAKL